MNLSRSEAIIFTQEKEAIKVAITVDGETFYSGLEMKALGIKFDMDKPHEQDISKIKQVK